MTDQTKRRIIKETLDGWLPWRIARDMGLTTAEVAKVVYVYRRSNRKKKPKLSGGLSMHAQKMIKDDYAPKLVRSNFG